MGSTWANSEPSQTPRESQGVRQAYPKAFVGPLVAIVYAFDLKVFGSQVCFLSPSLQSSLQEKGCVDVDCVLFIELSFLSGAGPSAFAPESSPGASLTAELVYTGRCPCGSA